VSTGTSALKLCGSVLQERVAVCCRKVLQCVAGTSALKFVCVANLVAKSFMTIYTYCKISKVLLCSNVVASGI